MLSPAPRRGGGLFLSQLLSSRGPRVIWLPGSQAVECRSVRGDESFEELRRRLRALNQKPEREHFDAVKDAATLVGFQAEELTALLRATRSEADIVRALGRVGGESAQLLIHLVRLCELLG